MVYSVSEEDGEELDGAVGDGELQIITECWVEPQCGVVVNSTPERKHFDGLSYKEVAQTVSTHVIFKWSYTESMLTKYVTRLKISVKISNIDQCPSVLTC